MDFSLARRYDRKWLLKEEIVFNALEDAMVAKMDTLTHQWHCSAAARSNMWDENSDDFEFHRKQADKTYKAIGRLTLPWYKWAEEMSLAEMWQKFKEYEKDPEFQAWRKGKKSELQKVKSAAEAEAKTLQAIAEARKQAEQLKQQRRSKHGGLRK